MQIGKENQQVCGCVHMWGSSGRCEQLVSLRCQVECFIHLLDSSEEQAEVPLSRQNICGSNLLDFFPFLTYKNTRAADEEHGNRTNEGQSQLGEYIPPCLACTRGRELGYEIAYLPFLKGRKRVSQHSSLSRCSDLPDAPDNTRVTMNLETK